MGWGLGGAGAGQGRWGGCCPDLPGVDTHTPTLTPACHHRRLATQPDKKGFLAKLENRGVRLITAEVREHSEHAEQRGRGHQGGARQTRGVRPAAAGWPPQGC